MGVSNYGVLGLVWIQLTIVDFVGAEASMGDGALQNEAYPFQQARGKMGKG